MLITMNNLLAESALSLYTTQMDIRLRLKRLRYVLMAILDIA